MFNSSIQGCHTRYCNGRQCEAQPTLKSQTQSLETKAQSVYNQECSAVPQKMQLVAPTYTHRNPLLTQRTAWRGHIRAT